jgi:hypothetical protein
MRSWSQLTESTCRLECSGRCSRDDFRTFLFGFVAGLPQVEFSAECVLKAPPFISAAAIAYLPLVASSAGGIFFL